MPDKGISSLIDWSGMTNFVEAFHDPVVGGVMLVVVLFVVFALAVLVYDSRRERYETERYLARMEMLKAKYLAEAARMGQKGKRQ